MKHPLTTLAGIIGVLVVGSGAFVYSGLYDVGADVPHAAPVFWVMDTLRARSIRVRSKDIVLPDLTSSEIIAKGAREYAEMCTGCHLRPGLEESEIRPGLYPQPPNLAQVRVDPRDAFWVIKHGVKMSGMPAWGATHDDDTIWSMVAFIQKMPDMTPDQYDKIVPVPSEQTMGMGEETHGHPSDQDHGSGHSHKELGEHAHEKSK